MSLELSITKISGRIENRTQKRFNSSAFSKHRSKSRLVTYEFLILLQCIYIWLKTKHGNFQVLINILDTPPPPKKIPLCHANIVLCAFSSNGNTKLMNDWCVTRAEVGADICLLLLGITGYYWAPFQQQGPCSWTV